jgi:predicted acylesterase/phospholipase RssA
VIQPAIQLAIQRPPAGPRPSAFVATRILAALCALALAACAGAPRHPVPEALVEAAVVPGYFNIRFWSDDTASIGSGPIIAKAALARARGATDWSFLAISGGGSNGAFGAGLITGWTATGTRPEFDVVTGISTGSLTAPFAFLGPAYDAQLTAVYTDVTGADIYRRMGILGALRTGALESDAPLRQLVGTYVTDAMVADIAREHRRGRLLLVGTTDLDSGRPVVWNIGAIAASDVPRRRDLILDVLVASASIPGVFPPVRIRVVADGVAHDELHVDGGVIHQAFIFPADFTEADLDRLTNNARIRTAYVIRNGKVTPDYSPVSPPRLPKIADRSMRLLIETQGVGGLYRMHRAAQRVGADFNAIWIPASFTMREPKPFDRGYMRAVYALGRQLAEGGIPWSKTPPK